MGIWMCQHAVTTGSTTLYMSAIIIQDSWKILDDCCWAPKEAFVYWLRLQTHMEWFPHPPHAYARWLNTFIRNRDGGMDQSSCCYNYTCWPQFSEVCLNLGLLMSVKWALMHWLRLQTHMEWFPHPTHTYARWLTTFICNGWGYGLIILPLPPLM
jgi:hypothetical protein